MVKLVYKLHSYDDNGAPLFYAELAALSSETKPTAGLISGSRCVEVDTGKTFVFDAGSDTPAWTELVVATAEVSA